MIWLLVGYMWLFIHRPFEVWLWLAIGTTLPDIGACATLIVIICRYLSINAPAFSGNIWQYHSYLLLFVRWSGTC